MVGEPDKVIQVIMDQDARLTLHGIFGFRDVASFILWMW